MSVDRRVAVAVAVAVVGGFLLGSVDFVWIKFVPYPFAELGNSSAVWAVAAFAFGYWLRSGWVLAALGAAVLLVVAVPSYYLAAAFIQKDAVAVIWAPTSLLWMLFGVFAGLVFGVSGTWAHTPGWRQTVGVALPGAVLFAEAVLLARRIGDASYGSDPVWPAIMDAALGVLLIVLAATTTRQRVTALATALPLAAVGFAGFAVAGFA